MNQALVWPLEVYRGRTCSTTASIVQSLSQAFCPHLTMKIFGGYPAFSSLKEKDVSWCDPSAQLGETWVNCLTSSSFNLIVSQQLGFWRKVPQQVASTCDTGNGCSR